MLLPARRLDPFNAAVQPRHAALRCAARGKRMMNMTRLRVRRRFDIAIRCDCLFGVRDEAVLKLMRPLPIGDFCAPLRWLRNAEQLFRMAQIAARVTASADALAFAKAARL